MCGRYSVVKKQVPKNHRLAPLLEGLDAEPTYNAAPSQNLPVVPSDSHHLEFFSWGLVPSWSKDGKGTRPINARAETITTSPMFNRLIRHRRCLVPADSFYEWQVKPLVENTLFGPAPEKGQTVKQPFRIMMKDEDLFAFAGLYDEWVDKSTGEVHKTFAIITTEANELVKPIHDRMPVILPPGTESLWLDPEEKEVLDLLRPFDAGKMKAYPISTLVNSPSNRRAEIINSL
ncbi:MAG: SOS response-associated peptidase [Adhaeribacter sp.]